LVEWKYAVVLISCEIEFTICDAMIYRVVVEGVLNGPRIAL
jgi:hypothetical protein